MQEPVSNVEVVCKAMLDSIAPELRGMADRLNTIDKRFGSIECGLKSALNEVRGELQATKTRVTDALNGAKRELVLTTRLVESEQRGLMLQQQLSKLQQEAH